MKRKIFVKDIIDFLKGDILSISGDIDNIFIKHIMPAAFVDEYSLDWINQVKENKQELAEKSRARAILVSNDVKYSESIKQQKKVLLFVINPKLTIAKIAHEFFVEKLKPSVHKSAEIHPEAQIGESVYIGPNVIIGKCIIGNRSIIHGNCYIHDKTAIGNDVIIQAGSILGVNGLGCSRNEENALSVFPHIGGLIIEDNVEIGANSQVARGVFSNTRIGKGSKINGLCFIAHNCDIGKNVWITGSVMLAGSVIVEDNVTIFSQVVVREQTIIGKGATIGMGSVVTRNIPEEETWFGNPARKMYKK